MFIFNLLNDQFSKPISHLLTRKLHSQKKSLQVDFNSTSSTQTSSSSPNPEQQR